jgi:hypothetical protein
LHGDCLYEDEADLEERLQGLLTGRTRRISPEDLRALLGGNGWQERAPLWDDFVAQVFGQEKLWYK